MQTITRSNEPPRPFDHVLIWTGRKIKHGYTLARAKISRAGGKRLATPAEMQKVRDKYAKPEQKP